METLISSPVSFQVDLQQMEVSCDPEQAYAEGCCELSNVVSQLPVSMCSLPLLVMFALFQTSHCPAVWRVC